MEGVRKCFPDNLILERLVKTYKNKYKTDLLHFHQWFCSRPLCFVILLLVIHSQDNVYASVSNSTSRLKHERNGRCKYRHHYF